MNLLECTNTALARIYALTTYYVGTKDDNDEVLIEINLRIEQEHDDRGATHTAVLEVTGEGGIKLTFQSRESDSPVEAIVSLGEHFDERGFLSGMLGNAPNVSFSVGPDVEDFPWPE